MSTIQGTFTGLGDRPQVVSATSNGNTLEVQFSEPMAQNAALINPANYAFGKTSASVVLVVASVEAGVDKVTIHFSNYATIGTNNYMVVVTGVSDTVGNTIDTAANSALFSGVSPRPSLVSASVDTSALDYLDVVFSWPVKQVSAGNADDALNPGNYAISGSGVVTVSSVISLSPTEVRATTSGHEVGGEYTLSVSNVEDLSNNAVAALGGSVDLDYLVVDPAFDALVDDIEGPWSAGRISVEKHLNAFKLLLVKIAKNWNTNVNPGFTIVQLALQSELKPLLLTLDPTLKRFMGGEVLPSGSILALDGHLSPYYHQVRKILDEEFPLISLSPLAKSFLADRDVTIFKSPLLRVAEVCALITISSLRNLSNT